MKKLNLFFLVCLFFLMSCGQENSGLLNSGLPLANSSNSDAAITLNYRINQEAIDAHRSLLFLNQLEQWNQARVPESFGVLPLNDLKALFAFLHKKENALGIQIFKVEKERDGVRLNFLSGAKEYEVWTNHSVTNLVFSDESASALKMTMITEGVWSIQNESTVVVWNVEDQTLCSNDDCVHL